MPFSRGCHVCQHSRYTVALVLFVAVLAFTATVAHSAQDGSPERLAQRLQITSLDQSRFPELGVNLIVTDGQSRPLSNLQGLRLRENGVPIADYEIGQETVGLDLIFVIEGDERLLQTDDDGEMTRLQRVRDTILFYSGRFMDVAGRDRVSVIVPGGESGEVLVQDVTEPEALINAVRGYEPAEIAPMSGASMLQRALDLAQASQAAGRFQAIVLFSDTRGLNSARFPPVVERAQVMQVPIFGLLLAPAQNEDAVATMSELTTPTRGIHVAIPIATDSSELFQVVQNNAVQTQVRYQSNLTRSGSYTVEVTLGRSQDDATLELDLAPPQVAIALDQRQIRRSGTQIDSPLPELQPAVQPVPVQISWPDGLPRRLASATLRANGLVQDAPFIGDRQSLVFDWDISETDAGEYALTVIVTDTLGMTAASETVGVMVEVVRPQPLPTAIPTATPEPFAFIRDLAPQVTPNDLLSPPVVGAIILFLLLLLVASQQFFVLDSESGQSTVDGNDATGPSPPDAAQGSDRTLSARLEPLEGALEAVTISDGATLGRSAADVDIVVDDSTLSPLHASIRR
ncbi:MAG TPA: hypothetical protein VK879_14300, partial [Candidatus Sulfomarinibacteraceae bacterium]|nr:hypothetical protein [Candidatus Sulfomarinibacteraceae bacterium]